MKSFGVSTHLYHGGRLKREDLLEIADHGFEAVELFATRGHFDYHDPHALESLPGWLTDAGLTMPSVHAPIVDALVDDRWGRAYSTGATDPDAWQATIAEMRAALEIARYVPFTKFVVHLGIPDAQKPAPADNNRSAVIRSIEAIHDIAEPLGVKVALEVMGNRLSTADALLDLIEGDLESLDLGICMDVGHAFLLGDPAEAIEATSGYLITTHLHDNNRRSDDHLVPFDGAIDWTAVSMALEKIGYDGVLMFEVKNVEAPARVLKRAAAARKRIERTVAGLELGVEHFS
jgi:sugar phosphate isomerase/epimerase